MVVVLPRWRAEAAGREEKPRPSPDSLEGRIAGWVCRVPSTIFQPSSAGTRPNPSRYSRVEAGAHPRPSLENEWVPFANLDGAAGKV